MWQLLCVLRLTLLDNDFDKIQIIEFQKAAGDDLLRGAFGLNFQSQVWNQGTEVCSMTLHEPGSGMDRPCQTVWLIVPARQAARQPTQRGTHRPHSACWLLLRWLEFQFKFQNLGELQYFAH